MKYFLLSNINDEYFSELMRFYNCISAEDSATIYLCGPGGNIDVGEAILNLINENKHRTTIVGYREIASFSVDLFFRCECPKKILPFTTAMIHLGRIGTEVMSNGKGYTCADVFSLKELRRTNKSEIEFYESIGLNKTELAKVKRGDNLYINHNRLLEILNTNNI